STSSSLCETKITVLPCAASLRQRGEELGPLLRGDGGGRLVRMSTHAQPEQASNLELLAFTGAQAGDLGVGINF
ncbi:hypothetical protein, partial [Candidatus Amarolinea dominans]|uniref:hypothetical protein n=1 Tax=Candidatus Amarolinea dominans TaxID=3140696 RepID=UPI0031CCB03D